MYKLLMLKIYQQTVSKPISFEGIGLHSGKRVKITIFPNTEDKGIIFKRVDLKNNNLIYANYKNVKSATLCTTIENEHGVRVSTVEHLLAALYISEIDNAIIEINNEEVPIMDGSAKEFFKRLNQIELKELNQKRKYLKILDKIELQEGKKRISIQHKDSSLEVEFKLNYKNKIIGDQENTVDFQNDDLEKIYESRTFCLYEDIEKIKSMGLAKGGSLENAIVVDNNKVMNEEGLRNKYEFVNHKILDLAGDFMLSGYRVLGKVKCHQGGHEFTNKFLKKLLSAKSSFTSVELKEILISKKLSQNSSSKLAVVA